MAHFVTPTGQRLHVEEAGSGSPVLFVHGWAMSSAAFGPLSSRLDATHRVVAYDLRGHGRSAAAAAATLDDHAADLVALLATLDAPRTLVVAWSLGAQILLRALASVRVRGAVLVGGTPRFTAGDGWEPGLPRRQVELLAARFQRDPARTRARFLADLLSPPERDALGPAGIAALDASMALPETRAALAGLEVLATADLRSMLGGLALPVLLLHGDADPICLPGASRAMADAIPGARLALLAGAGHAAILTRVEEVASAIEAFELGLR
jgi:pimeloyl-[acyl-carrier protein] methyl ester esterase